MRVRSLAVRLAAVQLVLGAIVVAVFVFTLNAVTVRAAQQLALRSDVLIASRIAPWVARYYRENGSFEGIREWLSATAMSTDEMHDSVPMMMQNQRMMENGLMLWFRDNRPNLSPPDATPGRRDNRAGPGSRAIPDQSDNPLPPGGLQVEPPGPTPIVVLTPQDRVAVAFNLPPGVSVDPERITGLPVEVEGRTVGRLALGSMVYPRLGAAEERFVRSIRLSALVAAAVLALLAVALGLVWYRTLAVPLRRLADTARTFGGGGRDVALAESRRGDEIGDLARAFTEMAGQVKSQEDSRRRFVADAAHELRTPLTLLQSQIELIQDGVYPTDPDQLDRMSGYTHRLSQLVDDLQVLARIDAGRFHISPQAVDAGDAIRHARDDFQAAAAQSGRSLTATVQANELKAWADPVRLQQTLTNLVSNALRYAPPATEIAIRVSETYDDETGRAVLYQVADHGPGIPKELRERVFERFVRLQSDRGRDSGGSGLGLAICRELVTRQGGRIWIESTDPGSQTGTTVCFTLPAADTQTGTSASR